MIRYILSLCLLLFLRCGNSEMVITETDDQAPVKIGRRVVPYVRDSIAEKSGDERFLSHLSRMIELPAIRKGFKNKYMRVWFWNSPDSNYIVDINHLGDKGSLAIYSINSNKGGDSIIIHARETGLQPLSGWKSFADSLESFALAEMPGYDTSLIRKGFMTRMEYVNFEIAGQNSKYRYFEYLSPYYYRFIDKNSARIHQVLLYLNKELGRQVYKPALKMFVDPSYIR